jgi:hypothetical protein
VTGTDPNGQNPQEAIEVAWALLDNVPKGIVEGAEAGLDTTHGNLIGGIYGGVYGLGGGLMNAAFGIYAPGAPGAEFDIDAGTRSTINTFGQLWSSYQNAVNSLAVSTSRAVSETTKPVNIKRASEDHVLEGSLEIKDILSWK